MKFARTCISLATAAALFTGAATAAEAQEPAAAPAPAAEAVEDATEEDVEDTPAEGTEDKNKPKEKVSEMLGYSREICEEKKDDKGNVIARENCKKVEIKPSKGSSWVIDGLTSSSDDSSSQGGSSEGEGSSTVPAWAIPVTIVGTLAALVVILLNTVVKDFSIRPV